MDSAAHQLPLFPLTAHILPGGRMKLRIFEPRYLRMVKESFEQNNGFGLCMLNPQGNVESNGHIFPVGTHVQVIDFEALNDGMLGITIEGGELFNIKSIHTEKNGLRIGEIEWQSPWQAPVCDQEHPALVARLEEVFATYPELDELYPEKHYDDIRWLCGRWLELLPLDPNVKQELISSQCPKKISEYICTLFE